MKVEEYFVKQNIRNFLIDEFLRQELENAGYSHVEVKRTPLGTRVIIYALRPGIVIGVGGQNIKRLTKLLEEKFNLEKPHIEVEQVQNPDLDPHIVAWRIAKLMEKGYYFKKVAMHMLERVMRAGARGVEIRLAGKLPSERARKWKFRAGYLQKCGYVSDEVALVAYAQAKLKPGVAGIKVTIIPPDARFPDEVFEKEAAVSGAEAIEEKPEEKPKEEEKAEEVKPEEVTEEEVKKELEEAEKEEEQLEKEIEETKVAEE